MYLLFTRVPGESYRRRLRPLLLCLCDVFLALISSLEAGRGGVRVCAGWPGYTDNLF